MSKSNVRIKHGHNRHRKPSGEYYAWLNMKARCSRKNADHSGRYFGRGIKVCKRWQESFAAFFEDMGPRPTAKHQIERRDNDGDYEPGNCRWATKRQQARNTCHNHFVTFKGKTQCLAAWAEELGINRATLQTRIVRECWSVEKALTTPPRKQCQRLITFRGKTQTLTAWAKELKLTYSWLHYRLHQRGWSVEKALTRQS